MRVAERPVIEKFGRFLLITRSDIGRAEQFLAGRGGWAILLGRALPFVRSFTSLVAGFAGVRALRFGVLSLTGTLIYAAAVSSIGYGLGSAWGRVAGDLSVAGYVIAALLVAAITAFIIFRLRALRREPAEDPSSPLDDDRAPRNGLGNTRAVSPRPTGPGSSDGERHAPPQLAVVREEMSRQSSAPASRGRPASLSRCAPGCGR